MFPKYVDDFNSQSWSKLPTFIICSLIQFVLVFETHAVSQLLTQSVHICSMCLGIFSYTFFILLADHYSFCLVSLTSLSTNFYQLVCVFLSYFFIFSTSFKIFYFVIGIFRSMIFYLSFLEFFSAVRGQRTFLFVDRLDVSPCFATVVKLNNLPMHGLY